MFKVLFLFLLLLQSVCATPIEVDETINYKEILSSSQVYIDKTRKLTIEDITTKGIQFFENDKAILGFGYSPNFDVWIRLEFYNSSKEKIKKLIEYDNPITSDIEFYKKENKYYKKIKEGYFFVDKQRQSLTPIFHIELEPQESKVFYIKASSEVTTLIVKLNLWKVESFYKQEIKHQIILTLFFGAMLIFVVYNLFIYFSIRENSYIYYVIYILGVIIHHLLYVGMAGVYILSPQILTFITGFAVLIVFIPVLAFSFLIKSFLKTKQYPIWDKILDIYLVLYVIFMVVVIIIDDFHNMRSIFLLLLLLYLMGLTIYAAFRGNRQARIVLIGWMAIIVAVVFMVLSSLGIYNIYENYPYSVELLLFFEAGVFSFALTDKIKHLQAKKNEANMELILQKEIENIKLTKLVEQKTKSLKLALDEKNLLLKELNHRVKNNMQTIVSLIRLQSKEIKDKKIKNMFLTIRNRINAMSHLHELLYSQDNTAYVNAYDYFNLVINELKGSYDDIEISLDIQTDLKVEQSIYCGLILNELVTNAFKYAFKDKNGHVYIRLYKKNEKYILEVEDDGIGYDKNQTKDTLGVVLVNTLVKEQLDGEIEYQTDNGVKVQVIWK